MAARLLEIAVHDRAIECAACSTRFPPCEGQRDSGGYCECGGELILHRQVLVRDRTPPEQILFTVVKATG